MNYPRPGNYRSHPQLNPPTNSGGSPSLQQRGKFVASQAGNGGYPSFASSSYGSGSINSGHNSGSFGSASPASFGSNGFIPHQNQYPSISQANQSNNRQKGHVMNQMDSSKTVANKIREDCYSKIISDNGHQVRETSFIQHIKIKEYSQFSANPPPANLLKQQLGSVKDRILVLCSRYSGRVLLQKGKFNDQKNQYQIGRTWDLDELKAITRAGPDGFILSLNKDYYWNCDEGYDKLERFVRNLTKTYSNFMGKYPVLNGWTTAELGLPDVPVKKSFGNSSSQEVLNPQPDAQLLKSKSLKRKNLPNPILPVPPAQPVQPTRQPSQQSYSNVQDRKALVLSITHQVSDHYKDIDFTANGQLPMKPMKALGRSADMSQTSLPESAITVSSNVDSTNGNSTGNHPYRNKTPSMKSDAEITNDSQSFIFNPAEDHTPPTVLPKQRNSSSNTRKESRNFSEPLETTAALHLQLEQQLSKPTPIGNRASNDFGIEEVDDTDNEKHSIEIIDDDIVEVSQSTKEIGAIDTSIQEIEDFMDSQLNFGSRGKAILDITKPKAVNDLDVVVIDSLDADVLDDRSYMTTEHDDETGNTREDLDIETELNITKRTEVLQQEKDAEIEELIEDLQWDVEDDGNTLIKKLTGELNKLKYNNVKELIGLDFSGDSMKDDLSTSLKEVENINHIFKRMEIDFKNLNGDISTIESNSQGLQVKSVNKKILYNDLKSILDKVSVSARDLVSIENFNEFDMVNKLPTLERQVLNLYNALETIRQDEGSFNDTDSNHLNSMNALKQYLANYEAVAQKFVKNFVTFFRNQFLHTIKQLDGLDRVYSKSLVMEFNSLTIYSSFTFFLKEISPAEFTNLKAFISSTLGDFLERLLKSRIKTIKYANSSTTPKIPDVSKFENSSDQMSLRKSRTLRLSVRKDRLIGKLGLGDDSNSSPKNSTPSSPYPDVQENDNLTSLLSFSGIEDTKTIVDLVNDTKDISIILTEFLGRILHYESDIYNLNEFVKVNSFESRIEMLDQTTIESGASNFSSDLVTLLTSIFGKYTNLFIKKVYPVDYNIAILLVYLESLSKDSHELNHEFFVFNFLKKLVDKYKSNWNKIVKTHVDNINKSSVSAKCGILPCIKNVNQFIHLTESTLDKPSRINGDMDDSEVKLMLSSSYKDIIEACIHLFVKNDPLLKNSEFDEKERNYRNVSIMENVFSMLEQLVMFNNERTMRAKGQLESVFKKVQDAYFNMLLHQNIGKVVEFVTNFEALNDNSVKAKKYNKKTVKAILSGYTTKDLGVRAGELRRKLEKHFISGNNMFEKDLLDKLWSDMEKQFVNYFSRLDNILTQNYSDIEFHISKQEIHSIFRSLC